MYFPVPLANGVRLSQVPVSGAGKVSRGSESATAPKIAPKIKIRISRERNPVWRIERLWHKQSPMHRMKKSLARK
jgi:hypothetical protein